VRWRRQSTPPFQLQPSSYAMQCRDIVFAFALACECTMYVKTFARFDSATHHADRVERNGMQARRSCNGETRDEMRWRVGKDGKVSGRNQSHACLGYNRQRRWSNVLKELHLYHEQVWHIWTPQERRKPHCIFFLMLDVAVTNAMHTVHPYRESMNLSVEPHSLNSKPLLNSK